MLTIYYIGCTMIWVLGSKFILFVFVLEDRRRNCEGYVSLRKIDIIIMTTSALLRARCQKKMKKIECDSPDYNRENQVC